MPTFSIDKETSIDKKTFELSVWYWTRMDNISLECFRKEEEAIAHYEALVKFYKEHGTIKTITEMLKSETI